VDGDFKFAYYLAAIRTKIASRWDPPAGVEFRPYPYRAVLYFRVQRDGKVGAVAVENTSGFPFFDQTAMRALQKASPLPPLPRATTTNT
jgi:TonB family protein